MLENELRAFKQKAFRATTAHAPVVESVWAQRPYDPALPAIFIWRGSVSRPWQLKASTPTLLQRVKYRGPIRHVLFESVCEPEGSAECVKYGLESGLFDQVVQISPQQGHGFALEVAFRKYVGSSAYFLKAEDDFQFKQDVDLDLCVALMERHSSVNQIAFNKRDTESGKPVRPAGKPEGWWASKEYRFDMPGREAPVTLTVRDKWWFGNSLWRMSFVHRWWQLIPENIHNHWNDRVLFPSLFGADFREKWDYPPAEELAARLGAFWWGPIGFPAMTEHTGRGDSLWAGQLQARWKAEGKAFSDGIQAAPGNSS